MYTEKQIINTDHRVFLVKFQFQSTNGQFICDWRALPQCLEEKPIPGHGIEYIKEFDPAKAKFKQVSKADILELFKDTDSEEFMNSHYYFK